MDLRLRRGEVSYQVRRAREHSRMVFHIRCHRNDEDGDVPAAAVPLEVEPVGGGEFLVDSPAGPQRGYAVRDGDAVWVQFAGATFRLEVDRGGGRQRTGRGGAAVASPMPGQVQRTLVEVGDRVAKGQPLLVVEAMKMQIEIAAPHAGVVRELPFPAGASVDAGVPLAKVEPERVEGGR